MTPEQTEAAVFLSILSSPVKLGLYDSLSCDPLEIKAQVRAGESTIQEHISAVYGRDPQRAAEKITEICSKKKISVLPFLHNKYPAILREIHKPPIVLYLSGELPECKRISIVGTRNSDRVSEDVTIKIASALSNAGYCIVSGMAYGIDRFAHLGALNSGGVTLGVLPGGIDTIYPYRNRDLYSMIASSEGSALISEYPPGIQSGQKWTFAQRNRIISGISPALVVVQAPRGSGALITARYALEQNRDIFVCPGHAFDDNYEGCHDLIRDGAVIISRMEDILSVIEPGYDEMISEFKEKEKNISAVHSPAEPLRNPAPVKKDFSNYSGVERELLESVASGIADIDIFTRNSSHSHDSVLRAVTILEIEGIIIRKGNTLFLQ